MKNSPVLSLSFIMLLLPGLIFWPGCATTGDRSVVKSGVDSNQRSKEEDTMQLLHLIVSDESFETIINLSIMNHMSLSPYKIPDEVWEEAKKEFKKEDFLRAAVLPVYDKNFTHKEILEMLEIYQEPVMEKYLAKQSTMLKETSLLAREWGFLLGEKVQKRLMEKFGNPSGDQEL